MNAIRNRLARGLGLLLVLAPAALLAQPRGALLLVGLHAERNSSLQPGVEAGYSSEALLGGRPRFTLGYSTTRLATAAGSHALEKDRFQLGAGWHFRPARGVDPYVLLRAGYTRFDREDDELFALLDDDAPIASLLVGVEAKLPAGFRLYGEAGYSALSSSTVYPFVASIGLLYALTPGGRP